MDKFKRNFAPGIAGGLMAFSFTMACVTNTAHASTAPTAQALKREILFLRVHSTDFDPILNHWQTEYGTQAIGPLVKIASDSTMTDADRYIAVMAIARLGGTGTVDLLTPYLKHRSWMLRNAALKALGILSAPSPKVGRQVLSLLNDKALVVRLQAVETIRTLRPEGASVALAETLQNNDNYHAGRALWVPQRALAALVELKAKETVPLLTAALKSTQDPALKPQISKTIEILSRNN